MTFAILELHCSLYILQVNTCNPTVIDLLWLFALAKTASQFVHKDLLLLGLQFSFFNHLIIERFGAYFLRNVSNISVQDMFLTALHYWQYFFP